MLDLWISLPDGLNRGLVAEAMALGMRNHGPAARSVGRRLNESYFDLFAAELQKYPRLPETIIVQTLPTDGRQAALSEMFRKMRLLLNGGDQRAKAFAKDPLFVTVCTAVVAGAKLDWHSFRSFVSVLLEAATPEALDVVLPHVERVIKTQGPELDGMRSLVKRRKNPALLQLSELLEGVAAERPGPRALERLMRELQLPALKKPLEWRWSAFGKRE